MFIHGKARNVSWQCTERIPVACDAGEYVIGPIKMQPAKELLKQELIERVN